MQLIIGLGNPGPRYAGTRHNFGFWALDRLQQEWTFPAFAENTKFKAALSSGLHDGRQVLLIKPSTFMNLSGEAVRDILNFYKLTPSDILVIQDELDLPQGVFRLAADSRAAGHRGVQNIIDRLGTQAFKRLRVGIAPASQSLRPSNQSAHDFVLARFTKEEIDMLQDLWPTLLDTIEKTLRS
ncbi:MAG: aminoacyl-tRNA hydrolase [Anaerolineae bacterium]|nr:aminoacyl-tRNA hydrolase [Anaerolineae bacterium]